jgi:hypothetical protein
MRLYACPFCGTPHAKADATRLDAVCPVCAGPLCAVARHESEEGSRRSLERMPRRLLLSFFRDWPPREVWTSLTEDVSIGGVRFTSEIALRPGDRLRIDCDFCSATGTVRHAHPLSDRPPLWDVGVEFLTLRLRATRAVFLGERRG